MNLDLHFTCGVGVHQQVTAAVTDKPMKRGEIATGRPGDGRFRSVPSRG
jgi:hypothetical protein